MKTDKTIIAAAGSFLMATIASIILVGPGVWWGDSLNAYIQSTTGIYGTAQPPLFALLCIVSRWIYEGSLPIFLFCIILYHAGLAIFVFSSIKRIIISVPLYLILSFWPILFANLAVLQTETVQLALLSLFVGNVYLLKRYPEKQKKTIFYLMIVALLLFSLVRYDTLFITILLGYWLGYTYFNSNRFKAIVTTVAIVAVLFISKSIIDNGLGLEAKSKSEMGFSLLVADIAAISAESGINYIPEYCWQDYLPAGERTPAKVMYGLVNWKYSFYSYIYNIDPSIGLFHYGIADHKGDLFATWIKVLVKHPLLYFKFHATSFFYLLTSDNFNMGLWSGLKDSHQTLAQLTIEPSEAVDSFLQKHGNRYAYKVDRLIVADDSKPVSIEEKQDLLKLVSSRRASDVGWMSWYSSIPTSVYIQEHPLAEKYVEPFFDFIKRRFRVFAFLGTYFAGLVLLFLAYRNRFSNTYDKTTFFILCLCGIIHIGFRFIFITDPVFRFGIISILFGLFAFTMVVSDLVKKNISNEVA